VCVCVHENARVCGAGGRRQKFVCMGQLKTQSCLLSTHYATGLCQHQLQLVCGQGSMSEGVCFPIIISCVLKQKRK